MAKHTVKEYEQELGNLRERLENMADRVEEMIENSIRALIERDTDLAEETVMADHQVNRDEMNIDEDCRIILAKRQPMAGDLRFLTVSFKMVTDLERIGDLAVNICRHVIDLDDYEPLEFHENAEKISDMTKQMVHDAIQSFTHEDVALAQDVIERDDDVDRLYHEADRDLIDLMREDDSAVKPASHHQAIFKHLERMADHTTNIAEQVIFMVRAKDIRHHHSENIR
jgi:phosphate transport system protein